MENVDMFQFIKGDLSNKDGALMMQGERFILVPVGFISYLQKGIENIAGPDGTYVMMTEAAQMSGRDVSQTVLALAQGLPFEQQVQLFLRMNSAIGWGKYEVEELTMEPFKLVVKHINSYVGDVYEGKADGPRCFLSVGTKDLYESLLKAAGRDIKLKVTETLCVAKGDKHCQLTFEEDAL